MRRRAWTVGLFGAGMALGAWLAAPAAAPPSSASASGTQLASNDISPLSTLVRADPHQALPLHGGTVDSLNWSGYVVTPRHGDVTGVTTNFVVPSAGLVPPGFAATWAGIGGYSTQDLLQAGVAEGSLPTVPLVDQVIGQQYYAWYELLPNPATPLTGCTGDSACTVAPGDHVSVVITQVSASPQRWSIAMTNTSAGGQELWTWSKTVPYVSSRSSAEWILEAPTLFVPTLLAPVGTVSFGSADGFTVGTTEQSIQAGDPTEIVLSPGLIDEATPSALAANGRSFGDCAYVQRCQAPGG